jgi:hypothetical protein
MHKLPHKDQVGDYRSSRMTAAMILRITQIEDEIRRTNSASVTHDAANHLVAIGCNRDRAAGDVKLRSSWAHRITRTGDATSIKATGQPSEGPESPAITVAKRARIDAALYVDSLDVDAHGFDADLEMHGDWSCACVWQSGRSSLRATLPTPIHAAFK